MLFSSYRKIKHNGLERSYLLSRPKHVSDDTKIIVGLHGYADSPQRFAYYSGLHNVVDTTDIVVYPLAADPEKNQLRGWNAGFCCGSGRAQEIDDVGFITTLASQLQEKFSVPSSAVYVTGFSNGAFMAHRLAAEAPNSVKAIAAASGTIGTVSDKLLPESAVPVLLLHGKDDSTVPFKGGTGVSDDNLSWLSFAETNSTWESVNKGQAPTKTIVYEKDGHNWHDWRLFNFWHKKPDGSIEVMKFFKSL